MNIISIHIFPHEIQEYDRVIKLLDKSIKHLDGTPDVVVESTLNNNPVLIDWGNKHTLENKIAKKFITLNDDSQINIKYAVTTDSEFM